MVFQLSKHWNEISSPNLVGKTYKGTITAWPNNMTAPEVIDFWIKAAEAIQRMFQ